MQAMEITGSVMSGFTGYFFDIILWIIILGCMGYGGWWYYINKIVYKYTFVEWHDHKNFRVLKGRLIKSKTGIKKFQIKEYTDPTTHLSIRQANGFFNGKPCRNVMWDGTGQLTYMEGVNISKDNYLETALTPIERTEAVDAQYEAAEKGMSMTTAMKWGLGVVTIIVVFLMITIVMVSKYGFEQSSVAMSSVKHLADASQLQKETQQMINANTIAMNNLAAIYVELFNITIEQELSTS